MYQPEDESNSAEILHEESERKFLEDDELDDLTKPATISDITRFLSKPAVKSRKDAKGYAVCFGKDGFYAVSEYLKKPRFLGCKETEISAKLSDLKRQGFSPISAEIIQLEEGLRQYCSSQ